MKYMYNTYDSEGNVINRSDKVMLLELYPIDKEECAASGISINCGQTYSVVDHGTGWVDISTNKGEYTLTSRQVVLIEKGNKVPRNDFIDNYEIELANKLNPSNKIYNVSFGFDELGLSKQEFGFEQVVTHSTNLKEMIFELNNLDYNPSPDTTFYDTNGAEAEIIIEDNQLMSYDDYQYEDKMVDSEEVGEYHDKSKQVVLNFIETLKGNK